MEAQNPGRKHCSGEARILAPPADGMLFAKELLRQVKPDE